jgi:hypothetical protein
MNLISFKKRRTKLVNLLVLRGDIDFEEYQSQNNRIPELEQTIMS